jgi:hypothetical protein
MAATKETFKVKDLTETVKGIAGLVKENYLSSVELALSLWEGNLKILHSQVDQFLNFHQDYIKAGRELYEKFPKQGAAPWNGNMQNAIDGIDRFAAYQKDYVNSVRSVSDKLTKEALNLTNKNVERAFSLFDDYINLFRT